MRIEVAGVAEVDRGEFFAAFIESEQFKIRSRVIEPGHALCGGTPGAGGNDDLETAEVTARVRVLAAVIEPENAEGENAVDDGSGFGGAYANHGIGRSPFEQTAADVCGTEAVLEIHGGAQAVDFRTHEMPREDALEEALIIAARGVACGGSAAVVRRGEFEELGLGRAHLACGQAQRLRT